jgi:AbiJ N-terminal domain 4
MPVFDLYSKRRKRQLEGPIDVFTYDLIPIPLRVQIVQILKDAFGDRNAFESQTDEIWKSIHKILAREYGKFSLGNPRESDAVSVIGFFINGARTDKALDFIELAFQHVEQFCNNREFKLYTQPKISPEDAVDELNQRFNENAVGYQYVSGQLIRKDNEFLHKEVVLPALVLLHEKEFSGVNEEYLSAHEHYRNGNIKECLNDCLKAFESVMKTICKMKNWQYKDNDTAKALIDVCFKNELIPSFLQSEVGALRAALEGGIPTVRNRLGGHGQGENPVEVPSYYASYLLNLTAATIVLLVKAAGDA